jgi:transposase-like protein
VGNQTGKTAAPEVRVITAASKSDAIRQLLRSGSSVAEAARAASVGYAFAYGVAARAAANPAQPDGDSLADVRANRRPLAGERVRKILRAAFPSAPANVIEATTAKILNRKAGR